MKIRWNMVAMLFLCFAAAAVLFVNGSHRSAAQSVYSDGQIRMEIQADASGAQPMKETSFRIAVADISEQPLQNANLTLNITMPRMFCGVFPATIVETEPGIYIATAIPVMQGLWQAEAILRWEDKQVTVSTLFHVQ